MPPAWSPGEALIGTFTSKWNSVAVFGGRLYWLTGRLTQLPTSVGLHVWRVQGEDPEPLRVVGVGPVDVEVQSVA